jgi:hypothetical protein
MRQSCCTALHRTLLLAAAAVVLSACRDPDVVAVVGRSRIRLAEVELAHHGALGQGDAAAAQAVEATVERALLAEAAREADLDEDAAVRARLAVARREILAQAFLDAELERAGREDLLRERYEREKGSLARKRVHVRLITALARTAREGGPNAARSLVTRAFARVVAGEPFEAVAKDMSEDPVSVARGGDMGPLLEGQVDAGFFAAVAGLAKGETSRPFETSFGFHLAQAVEDPTTVTPTFEEARGRLVLEARREAEAKLQERLRSRMTVRRYPDALAARAAAASGAQKAGAPEAGARAGAAK